ncbi:MAG TPA: hypothetical protein PLV96_07400 [Methanoregulaceae archaeon]|nr:hypothetical protein [Methanoregulaceae archaeon]
MLGDGRVLVQQGFFKKQVNQVLDLIWLVDSGGIVRHKVAECRMVVVGAVSVICPVPVWKKDDRSTGPDSADVWVVWSGTRWQMCRAVVNQGGVLFLFRTIPASYLRS